MNTDIQARWVTALTDGSYQQGNSVLTQYTPGGTRLDCCLGVLCDLAVKAGVITAERGNNGRDEIVSYGGYEHYLPPAVTEWAGLTALSWDSGDGYDIGPGGGRPRTQHNDAGSTFTEIAAVIAAY